MDVDACLKMSRARSDLVLEHPFFANLLLRMDMREDKECGTAWSDGRFLAYNPAYVACLPLEKVKGLQCHTVLHLACGHHLRRDGRDEKLWNMACDYAINPILLAAGLCLPDGFLDDIEHHGKSAEAIYARLADRGEEANEGAGLGAAEGETDQEAGLEGEIRPQEEDRDGETEKSEAESQAEQDQRAEAGGAERETDGDADPGSDPGLSGEVRDAPAAREARGEDDGEDREDMWNLAAAQALNASRRAGDLPGSLERLLGHLRAPGLDWRELLSRFVSRAARNDFSWVRPNRRHLHQGLYLPGLMSMDLVEVAVVVDTSGSIGQAELDAFAGELSGVLETYDAPVAVLICDAAVASLDRLGPGDLPLEFTAKGGGGTDFRPPFRRIHEEGLEPTCLVYFTDMRCNAFPEEPPYPVLWVTPNPDFAPPPFGEVAAMEAAQ